ncbi:hypothetical protein GDO86_001487 [Hymenochirus boettgeri]|uniref:RNA uridylyltransferase n=1 Tax=Hymenochirus boettgeri TaxID=247094 RepID=A0A8T2KEY3_9PIPI|nr:hypothetical protein GDO86_001487 [Hymenochirus boettgeri]
MGEAVRQDKHQGLMEEEYKLSPIKQMHANHEGQGNKKIQIDLKRKPNQAFGGSSPRNSQHLNSFKPFSCSPSGRSVISKKDGQRKWNTDDQRSNSDNWRNRKQPFMRPQRDSIHEAEDAHWMQDGREISNEESVKQEKQNIDRRRRISERYDDDYIDSPVIDESTLSKRELLGLQQAEERLKRDCIYRLKKRPRKFPTAIYICKLCDALMESISFAHRHIKEKRHKRNMKEKKEEELLNNLPPPDLLQSQAITTAVSKLVQEYGLEENDLEKRLTIVKDMENVIQQKLPGCTLRLYGSSCDRFGFKNSDLNIDIQFPANMNQPDVLLLVQESLKQSDLFTDFDADFHARVPVVVCREKQSSLLCKVSAGNENACLTSNLLAALDRLEPRIFPLVLALRYWAKLCCIDRPEEGSLPPYVFALMVVFFLQQRKQPILPVYLGTGLEGFSVSKLDKYYLLEIEEDFVIWEYNPATESESCTNENSIRGKVPLAFDATHQCTASIGQLWVELLRFYALEFNMADLVISIRIKEKVSRESKDWPKKRIAIEDPFSVKRNVARSLNSQLVFDYILHCLRTTYKYFAMHQKKSSKANKKPIKTVDKDNVLSQNVPDKIKVADMVKVLSKHLETLEIDPNCSQTSLQNSHTFHRNYNMVDVTRSQVKRELVYNSACPDNVSDDPDCIIEEYISGDPEESVQSCEELESFNDESEDEDVNVCHDDENYIIDQCLDEDSDGGEAPVAGAEETDSLSDLENFTNTALPACEDLEPKGGGIHVDKNMDEESTEGTDEHEEMTQSLSRTAVNDSEDDEDGISQRCHLRDHLDSLTADEDLEQAYTGSMDEGLSDDADVDDDDDQPEHFSVPFIKELQKVNELSPLELERFKADGFEGKSKHADTVDNNLVEDTVLFYEFNKKTFTRGKLPTVVCNLCRREGHLKKDCPEDFKKLELDPLPPLTSKFRTMLDQVCIQCYKDFCPTVLEDKAREYIRHDLEDFIKREFPGARLNLFGSSKNGFGFKQSDLDICMTIEGKETAEELDSIRTIEELARHLRKHQGLRNILPITTAKVPIVKFYHVRSGLEGDISLYNTLALHNTRLLASYAAIDPRVKYLCYIMKVFTKMCDIGDASRGSLSSYAYTLMVLYFLQQRNPPVIPVLQEIYKEHRKPEIIVDGWNVYFFDKLDELASNWPDYSKNKESVGELWLGLLRFYTEEFDFKEHVISIRRKSLLTTFKKQWTSKYIVIEDPFDLNHNLGAGLSRKMTNFIMKAYINGRRLFGTPIKGFPKEYPTKMEYFFDPEVLTEGELAPNDRCCRICGKIGHFMRDCPMRRKVRRRNNENAMNQRHLEVKLQRQADDKEALGKSNESEATRMEGKLMPINLKKPKQGAKEIHESCRNKPQRAVTDKWRRSEDRELREKRCFICGREGHIKKECPQHKSSVGSPKSDMLFGSPSAPSPLKHQARISQVASPVNTWLRENHPRSELCKIPESKVHYQLEIR